MAVTLRDVHKRFGELVAVQNLNLEIGQAEFFSIIGPSGCGKTTTLRMIAGFEEPTSGTIHVAGVDVTNVRPYRRPVNTVFQSYALFPHLDVYENVAFGLREARRPRAEIRQRVGDAIALVQLEGRERSRPQQLSGGQQQRVALARALVNRPEVLLLDEPLGALDLKLRAEMQTQLKDMQRAVGITFCYVTHDQDEAFSMSDRVAVMNRGVLEQVGPPEDVYRRPRSLFVADFVGSANRLAGEIVSHGAEGAYAVRIDGLGERRVSGPSGLATGERVAILIRPEDVDITTPDETPTGIAATVIDVAFLGAQRTYRLETAAGGRFIASARAGGPTFAPGSQVALAWSEQDAWVLSDTTPGEHE